MSKNSEAVKRWRINTKERMVSSMGGKCVICGYDKCSDALEFHHLDPNEKEIGLGGIRGDIRGWSKIAEELRKCVLLCSNCHKEVHSSRIDTSVPIGAKGFNEDFAEYKKLEEMDSCPVCGNDKPIRNKTCSKACAGSMRAKIDWNSVDLESMLERLGTFVSVAEELGISEAAVRKRYKIFNGAD